MDKVYLILATLVFLAGFLNAVFAVRSGRKTPGWVNILIASVGFVLQGLFLRERGDLHGRCPITNGAEVLVFVSWSTTILYLILGRAFRLSLLGLFAMPTIFLFQTAALLYLWTSDPGASRRERVDPWLEVHAGTSLLAYGALGLAAIAGVMYLVQNRLLKRHKTGRMFYSLPPVRYLADAQARLLVIGTLMLSIGVVSAFLMSNLPQTLHLVALGAVWLVYLVTVVVHLSVRLAPRRLSLCSIGAFVVALVTLAAL